MTWLAALLERWDRLLTRRRQRSLRKQVLPAPDSTNPHWRHGGTDEVKALRRTR